VCYGIQPLGVPADFWLGIQENGQNNKIIKKRNTPDKTNTPVELIPLKLIPLVLLCDGQCNLNVALPESTFLMQYY
jgi:hypothetical protein